MPGKMLVLQVLSIMLQYSLVFLLYYFLFKVVRLLYTDLKTTKSSLQSGAPVVLSIVDSAELKLAQSEFKLNETVTIGRNEHNDIVLNTAVISHEHACISRDRQGYWLADLNSTNGTYLNDRRITEEMLLANDDIIKIGPVTFKFKG